MVFFLSSCVLVLIDAHSFHFSRGPVFHAISYRLVSHVCAHELLVAASSFGLVRLCMRDATGGWSTFSVVQHILASPIHSSGDFSSFVQSCECVGRAASFLGNIYMSHVLLFIYMTATYDGVRSAI